jgi:hypothetical protein
MARFSDEQLQEILGRRGYAAASVAPRLPDPIAQRDAGPAPHEAAPTEEAGGPRIAVRITRCGTRLLDFDNAAGGCKPLVDALRYRGLIPEDDPESIHMIIQQRKVSKEETGTIIEIYPVT